ncbi:PKD domain protein, partial [Candidatus Magnetomorum sp. HK-1]
PIYGNGIIELTEECDNDTFLNNITSCEAYSKKFSFGNVGCSDRGRITTDNCVLAPCTLLPPTFDNNHWIETLTESQEIKLFVQGSECHGEKVTFNVYYAHDSVEGKILIDTVEASSNADGFAIAVWNVVVPTDAPKDTLRYYLEAVPEYGDSTWIEGSGWIVENESGQPNQAPVVDAGLDQTITLSNNTVTLKGVVSDDGLPENPGVVVTTWSLISGPESVSFSDVNAFNSNVTFSAPGIYILNLNADDGDLQSNDELSVTVESAPLLTASRMTGVAPLGVNFTAGVPASTPESRPFHDLDYVWDFGDQSGNVWAVSGKSKDTAQGPVAAHIFETPGVYTVTLTTSDQSGPISVETVQITIQDPNLVYSGTNTICICDAMSNDFTGCPSGAQQITTDDVSDIKSAVASNRRILLQRGSSWSSDGLDSSETRIGYSIVGPVTS